MEEKKQKTANDTGAREQAKQDIKSDPDLRQPSPAEDLDEGELAGKDNSTEKAFDALENKSAGDK